MIGAVCFSLRTAKGGVIPAAHGHLLHAALFDYFRRRSPELSARLHDEMNLKPFTASMLELPPAASRGKNRIVLREGDPAIWRVTALNETVLRVLLDAASSDSGGEFTCRTGHLDEEDQRVLLLLAQFANFSGVGRLTGQGLG